MADVLMVLFFTKLEVRKCVRKYLLLDFFKVISNVVSL